ncbi:hypothetical protein ACN28S_18350 [Cystobacter fuscus]
MEHSSDGFVIAEKDLEIRGPGEFLGTRQSGLPELAVANLARDGDPISIAQQEARAILARDPQLRPPSTRAWSRRSRSAGRAGSPWPAWAENPCCSPAFILERAPSQQPRLGTARCLLPL